MSQFDSEQLIVLMSQAGNHPQLRLLSLFDILNDQLRNTLSPQRFRQKAIFDQNLTDFCIQQTKKSGAKNPAILAEHILLIAQNAFNQQISHPDANSLMHAKKAANALIQAQTDVKPQFLKSLNIRTASYGLMASCSLCIAAFLLWPHIQHNTSSAALPIAKNFNETNSSRNSNASLTAHEAAAMYAKYETMRSGTCQFIEALQIPDKDKAVYLESVVGGKLPTNLGDLATANAYLEKIRCNYTPMLMSKSK